MQYNYDELDAVFESDCPVCAVNLKTMWCEYACNANKTDFETNVGVTLVNGIWYQNIEFTLNPDYACDIFQSCEQVSFIAQADITSSLAFMDFLGVNGQN